MFAAWQKMSNIERAVPTRGLQVDRTFGEGIIAKQGVELYDGKVTVQFFRELLDSGMVEKLTLFDNEPA